jgi:hypothetical protein
MQVDLQDSPRERLAGAGFSPEEIALIQGGGEGVVRNFTAFSPSEMRRILDALIFLYTAQNLVTREGRGLGIPERLCLAGTLALQRIGLAGEEVFNTGKRIRTTPAGDRIASAIIRERMCRMDTAALARGLHPLVPLLIAASSHGKYVQKSFCADFPRQDGGAFLDFLAFQNPLLMDHLGRFGQRMVSAGIGVIVDQGHEGRFFVFPPEIAECINILLHRFPDDVIRHAVRSIEHVRRKYMALTWLGTTRYSGDQEISPEMIADLTTILEQLKPSAEVLRYGPHHSGIRFIVRDEQGFAQALALQRKALREEIAACLEPNAPVPAQVTPDPHPVRVQVMDPEDTDCPAATVQAIDLSDTPAAGPPEILPLVDPLPLNTGADDVPFPADPTPSGRNGEALTVFLGASREGRKVFWAPGTLNNGHCILIGGSGAGKTETLRCIARELEQAGYPVLMIDFHGDMAFPSPRLATYRIREGGEYFFNPLELDPAFTEITPLRATSDFVDAISINFPTLGIQQRRAIKGILKDSYQRAGITLDPKTWVHTLDFDAVQDQILACEDETIPAYLEDIFDYRLFAGHHKLGIADVLREGITHMNLNALPENLRYLFADLFLRRLFYSLQAMGEIPRDTAQDRARFRIFVIVDEAKLLVSQKSGQKQAIKAVLNKYATEMRKFGVGLILASQLISHFNDEILANIAVKFCMRTENKKQAQENSRFFEVGETDLMNLSPGEGILSIGSEKLNIRVLPLSARCRFPSRSTEEN